MRYSHVREGDRYNGFHTVNEGAQLLKRSLAIWLGADVCVVLRVAIRAEGWLESVRFYTKFILNCDEYL